MMFKINTDRTVEVFEYTGYQSLNDAVGGWIEAWNVVNPDSDNLAVFWFNEEGKIHGLELNEVATVLAHQYGGLPRSDFLVGSVVVTGQDGPEIGPLDADWSSFFVEMIRAQKA